MPRRPSHLRYYLLICVMLPCILLFVVIIKYLSVLLLLSLHSQVVHEALGPGLTLAEAAEMVDEVDDKHQGKISLQEVSRLTRTHLAQSPSPPLHGCCAPALHACAKRTHECAHVTHMCMSALRAVYGACDWQVRTQQHGAVAHTLKQLWCACAHGRIGQGHGCTAPRQPRSAG